MILAYELMEQADHLITREPRRPRPASLRRAVSASYYGLFHLLNGAAADLVAPNVSPEVNHRIQRWMDHGQMRRVCGRFLAAQLGEPLFELLGPSASSPMQTVASAFIELQDARHRADYDLSWTLTRAEAAQYVGLAWDAFDSWKIVQTSSEGNIFLLSLLLWKNWEKDR